jgi:hypothetical protein
MDLPNEGELKRAFAETFHFEFFRERKAEPAGSGKVTVQLFGKRGKRSALQEC